MLLFSRFKVQGHSMEPEFREGSRVVISGLPYLFSNPRKGDIIAFENPKQRKQRLLKKIEKNYTNNSFYVTGLNKNDSFDSTKFGPIKRKQILGKVIFKY